MEKCRLEGFPKLSARRSLLYGLWRVDVYGKPVTAVPLYIGETRVLMSGRIEQPPNKCHRDWWGDGKPMGITLCEVGPAERKRIETCCIDALVPFCNGKGSRLCELWKFPRPA